MTGDLQHLAARLKEDPLVEDVRLESDSAVGFALDPGAVAAIVVTFVLTRFSKALIDRAADDLWAGLRRFLTAFRKRWGATETTGRSIGVKYTGGADGGTLEILVSYDSLRDLRLDARNHQRYAALALGYGAAGGVAGGAEAELRDLLPPEMDGKPLSLRVRRASAE